MDKLNRILWGLVFIVLGVVVALNALDIINFNIFFNGWWTLIIIIPCFIGLFDVNNKGKFGNFVGLIIGIVLLSNRVHPSRENTLIYEWRKEFHDLVMKTYKMK